MIRILIYRIIIAYFVFAWIFALGAYINKRMAKDKTRRPNFKIVLFFPVLVLLPQGWKRIEKELFCKD